MNRIIGITFTIVTILAAGNERADAEIPVDIVAAASDWYFESELTGERAQLLLEEFEKNSRTLDSLLNIFMPLDTVSGFTGDERVWRIAECYTRIGMYEEAAGWWKILRRNDEEGFFKLETSRGLLETGVELSDSTLLVYMLSSVELWDSSIKTALAPELVKAIEFLYLEGVDARWLYTRVNRLDRFLPEFDAGLLKARLLIAGDEGEEAFTVCEKLAALFDRQENSPSQAKALLELMFTSSVLAGRFDISEAIIGSVRLYGTDQLVDRARIWMPTLLMFMNLRDEAAAEYALMCEESPDPGGACFWKEFMDKYKETLADVQK